jgi:FkbM family methyltransferase
LDSYLFKRTVLRPYFALMRRVLRGRGPFLEAGFAAHNYGPAFLKTVMRYARDPKFLYRASVKNVRLVVDMGAFDGEWAANVHQEYGARVLSFEPWPAMLSKARQRLAPYPQVELYPYGLAAADKEVDLYQLGPGSTVHADAWQRLDPQAALPAAVHVVLRDVIQVFDELDLHRVDVLKINVEGTEYEILDRLIATGYIERCRCVFIQFHEWFPDAYARRRRIHLALRRTHRVDWSDYFVWERWTRRGERRVA